MNSVTLKKAVRSRTRSELNTLTLASLKTKMFLHQRETQNDKRCKTLELREKEG